MNHCFRRGRLSSVLAALLLMIALTSLVPLSSASEVGTSAPGASAPALAVPFAGWVGNLYQSLENALRDSQKRAVQFCLVGMLLALWIIWWRK